MLDLNDSRNTAARIALLRGRAALFVPSILDDEEGKPFSLLSPEQTVEALHTWTVAVHTWTQEAELLGAQWDATTDPSEAEELCAQLLKFRMDVYAASITLDASFLATPSAPGVAEAIDAFNDAVEHFDGILEGWSDILCTLTGTGLLENWRARLAKEHLEILPWWLDGRLEATAAQLAQ